MRLLDREGIFKARLLGWKVLAAKSGAVAVSCEFHVLAQWDSVGGWSDWSEYEEHRCFGSWWVVKKGGQINTDAVEQLTESLGWNGDLHSILATSPDRVVQITVKADQYNGQTRFKAAWMNPENHAPQQQVAGKEKIGQLQNRFGSLLRAAAASTAGAPAAPAGPITDNDIPF